METNEEKEVKLEHERNKDTLLTNLLGSNGYIIADNIEQE